MIYNNLIYLLVILFILVTSGVPDTPQLPIKIAAPLFLIKLLLYQLAVNRAFSRNRVQRVVQYIAAEQKISILAILSFAADVYLLDCQYFFAKLPFSGQFPVAVYLAGLILFFIYLGIMWRQAAGSYHLLFGGPRSPSAFLFTNIKTNLPIILPWLLLTLFSDLLSLSSFPYLKKVLASPWGEPLIFFLFFLILAITFPALVTRLWNCSPLPAGKLRARIEQFCRDQGLHYKDIMIWPLFEGRMLTAAIMGITRQFRYLLITPALLKTLTFEELEAVLAHEIGHVKNYHLQLYLFLLLGFSLLANISTYPVLYLLVNSDIFYRTIAIANKEPGPALSFFSTIPLFVFMIVYFRFIFGFFLRNFERQADLHAFKALDSPNPLIRVLEKIAWISGDIRDLPSWHHFGIGQRVNFLEKCQKNRTLIKKHQQKVSCALLLYLLVVAGGGVMLWKMPTDVFSHASREKFTEAVVRYKIIKEPTNQIWHQLMGDLLLKRLQFGQAAASYEKALHLAPDNPDVLNNLAWVLLTAADKKVLDPERALQLAQKAALIKPESYILDTLATAYWQTGEVQKALLIERRAMTGDPARREYYYQQMKKFAGPRRFTEPRKR